MANILSTYWLKSGLQGTKTSEAITQTEVVIVVFDEIVETVPDAIAAAGFQEGQPHRTFENLYITGDISAEIEDADNAKVWRFELNYSTKGFSLSVNDNERRVTVKSGTWTYSQAVEVDKETGAAIENSAGDPYDPKYIEQISSPVIIVTKRENSPKMDRIPLIGSINNAAVTICGIQAPKYCAMFSDYQSEPSYDEEGYLTFLNTITIKFKFNKNVSGDEIGFKIEALNAGFNKKVGGVKEEITVKTLQNPDEADPSKWTYEYVPVATPQELDKDGDITGAIPSYKEFVVHDLMNFQTLKLPTAYPVR